MTEVKVPVITNVRLTGEERQESPVEAPAEQAATPIESAPEEQPEDQPSAQAQSPVKEENADAKPSDKQDIVAPEFSSTVAETEPYDWYKENGFDETHKEFLDKFHSAVKANKTQEFFDVVSKNYDQIKDIDLLRMDIRERNPKATEKQLEILEKNELKSRGIDLEDLESDQSIEGFEILALDMDKIREGYKSKQKEYSIPTYEADKVAKEQAEKQRQDYLNYLNTNEDLRTFERDKSVNFGDEKVALPEGLDVRSYLENPAKFWALFDDGKNGIDMQRLAKTLIAATDPDGFYSNAVKKGFSSAEKAHFDEVRNPKVGSAATAVVAPDDGKPRITNIRHTGS